MKNAIGNLTGTALNLWIALGRTVILTTLIPPSKNVDISPSVCVIFDSFHHCLTVFSEYRSFASLIRFIPRYVLYFIFFNVMINKIVPFISLIFHC